MHDASSRMKSFYAQLGLTDESLDYFAQEANNRRNPLHSLTRAMPPFAVKAKRGLGRYPKDKPAKVTDEPKRKPGRPKGSKNKKTLEKETIEANMPPQPKRTPGRPKGNKSKKTLEKEAILAAPKRGRGRPKESKNKKTLKQEELGVGKPCSN